MLDLLKLAFCLPFFLYACHTDLTTRRVPNKLWVLMAGLGSFFVAYEMYIFGSLYLIWIAITVIFTYIFVWILFRFGAFGGADAKALITLAFIFPEYPNFIITGIKFPINDPLPLLTHFFIFGIFDNAILIVSIIPICLAIYNVSKMGFHIDKPLYAFIGFKIKTFDLPNTNHLKLIEGSKADLTKDEVWVTPGLPFIVPITMALYMTAFFGDLMLKITGYILV